MIEVTQVDREAAAKLADEIQEWDIAKNILAGTRDKYVWVQAFAAHRIAAEKAGDVALATAYQCGYDAGEERATKAVLDRLREPTHEMVSRLNAACDTPDVNMAWVFPFIATALADALEAKP